MKPNTLDASTDFIDGLTTDETTRLRAVYGRNVLPEPRPTTIGTRVVRSIADPLNLLLLAAGLIGWIALHETTEGIAIIAIIVINIVIRVTQERRADKAVRSLRSYSAPTARVRRDKGTSSIPASDIVPGDIVEVGAGERISADMRLLQGNALLVDEALLTGESQPLQKQPLTDELFAGTMVLAGHGIGQVTSIGADTEIGKISNMLTAPPPVPLERELRHVTTRVSALACAVGAVMSAIATTRIGDNLTFSDAILSGVAIAIAAVPEGLVIAVTLALAAGAQNMARQGMIVKRLSAIEALGAASVLCSDKTGTLTEGRLSLASTTGAVCEAQLWNAILSCSQPATVSGDPIDIVLTQEALLRNAHSVGVLTAHQPFDSTSRVSSVVHETTDGPLLTIKGAPEVVLARCRNDKHKIALVDALPALMQSGQRVLAIAQGRTMDANACDLEPLGLIGLTDALRPTAHEMVTKAKHAGISVVMITGDHADTAAAIATQAGIVGSVVTSSQLHALPSDSVDNALRQAKVVARVDPSTKVALVDAHQKAGHVVAMTGDGVNDAPALRRADVGIAVVGSGGTDVAREAADLVITGGDLGTILSAIEEGRCIYRNIVNVVAYLLSGNLCEIIVLAVGLFLFPQLAVPLLPVQILWINLVTDGLPALALGVDRPDRRFLDEQPRIPGQHVLDRQRLRNIALLGMALAIPVLIATTIALALDWSDGAVRAQLVTSLVVGRLGIAYVVQSDERTFRRGWWRGRTLLIAVVGSLMAQVSIITVAPLRSVFAFDAMPITGWLFVPAVLLTTVMLADGARTITRRSKGRND